MSKANGTKVNTNPAVGCNDCISKYASYVSRRHSADEWHCYECNGIYVIDFRQPYERRHENHNWDKEGSQESARC